MANHVVRVVLKCKKYEVDGSGRRRLKLYGFSAVTITESRGGFIVTQITKNSPHVTAIKMLFLLAHTSRLDRRVGRWAGRWVFIILFFQLYIKNYFYLVLCICFLF